MGKQGQRVPAKTREEILRLCRNGMKPSQVAKIHDVSKKFVYTLIQEANERPGMM